MKPADAAAQAPLVFPWRTGHRLAPFLPVFLLFSLAAHFATFFLFRVVYPQRVSIPPPPPQVSLLMPITPENQALLRLIESEDPALVASGAGSLPPAVPDVQYRPSFNFVRSAPRTVPPPAQSLRFPSAKPAVEIIRSAETRAKPPPPLVIARPTKCEFDARLAVRIPEDAARFSPVHRAKNPLEPAAFLIGVAADGAVRFTFLQHPCGDGAIDAEIAGHLSKMKFAPSTDSMTWSIVSISWGDDAFATGAASTP
ncbi:MAG TPA: hypothetical protein VFV83_01750 [Chthoniobacteraceae bacterium]|nr:hypothetical protein [Chthoniobacteraceae bacterium]